MSRKILIVEHDGATAEYLAKGLSEAGCSVERCANGRDGLVVASEGIVDLTVADRMLPVLDGVAMTGAIRAAGSATPVLMLTALASIDNRVGGLRAGGRLLMRAGFLRRTARAGGRGRWSVFTLALDAAVTRARTTAPSVPPA